MKILLALDLSAGSQVAVDEVAMRPWPAGTVVHVVGVSDTEKLPFASDVAEEIMGRTHAVVAGAVERLKSVAGLSALPRVVSGDPRTLIIEHAQEIGADLIVLGAHKAVGVTGFLLGSVSKTVLRMAHCSVEVARHTHRTPDQGIRILLAVDESDYSTAAARAMAARPWPPGTEVRVMSAVELAPSFLQSAFEPAFVDTKGMDELREQAIRSAENSIQQTREILTDAGVRTSEHLSVLLEDPKKAILDEAQDWNAELIAVGSHGRRGLQRFMLGSVSEAVAMHATCTVEIVRTA